MMTKTARFSLRRICALTLFLLASIIAFGSWALSSPVGSSPDEDFHLASIWCGSGERDGLCELNEFNGPRLIPSNIEHTKCFAQKPEISGACQGDAVTTPITELTKSTRVNSGSQYPSGFYFWTSLLASENLTSSVLLIRLVNSALFVVLSVTVWSISPHSIRTGIAVGGVLSLVPLGMFFIPSANPTSWSIISAILLLPTIVSWFTATGWKAFGLAVLAIVISLIGMGARGDSAIYSAIACLAALVLMARRSKSYLLRAILPTAIIGVALVSYFQSAQGSLALSGMTQDDLPEVPLSHLVFDNLLNLPELLLGVFGVNFQSSSFTGLGWLDTPMPAVVWASTLCSVFGIAIMALRRVDARHALAITGVGIALVTIPMVVLTQGRVPVGWQVQPRYIMPLVVMALLVVLLPNVAQLNEPRVDLSVLQAGTVALLLSLANSASLFTNLQRYVAPNSLNLNSNIEWWWDLAVQPLTVFAVGSLAFATCVSMALFSTRRGTRAAQNPTIQLKGAA